MSAETPRISGTRRGGGDRDGELGHGSAERNDGQPDDERRNAALPRNARGAVHKEIRPLDQEGEPDNDEKDPEIQHDALSLLFCVLHTAAR